MDEVIMISVYNIDKQEKRRKIKNKASIPLSYGGMDR